METKEKLFLKIAYVGTAYCGYQVQPNGVTVQEKLNEAAKSLFGFDCDVVGCSRTDSGVHARGFCATVSKKGENTLYTAIEDEKLPRAFNAFLPPDIAVLEARRVAADFHPRYDVISKEYEYLILDNPVRDPFWMNRAWQIPHRLTEKEVATMAAAARLFLGEQDFSALRDGGADTAKEDAVRHVFSVSVERKGKFLSFRVRASGFLYHMVRIMVGTLMAAAKGTLSPAEIETALKEKNRAKMGSTAPPEGLYLDRVFYE